MRKSNRELAIEYSKGGLGYQEIADKLHISRQRVHQLISGYKSPYKTSEQYREAKKLKRNVVKPKRRNNRKTG